MFDKLQTAYGGDVAGKTIAVWGLSFKPKTDDMREAPSRVLMQSLWEAGARVQAYDPEAREEAHRIFGDRDDLTLCDSSDAALQGADALVIVTEWQEFRSPDYAALASQLSDQLVVDGRNLYDPDIMAAQGLRYYAVGRGLSVTTDPDA